MKTPNEIRILIDEAKTNKEANEILEAWAEEFKPKWIEIKSAKDFPKKYGHVMVYGRFTKDCPMNVYQALFNPKGGKFYSDGILSKGVTHWMPLPQPPTI